MVIILFDGTTMDVQETYPAPGREMLFLGSKYHLLKKECMGTIVYRCTPEGKTISPIGHLDVRSLWQEFGDVPMNPETECIDKQWHHFPAGTFREDVWTWFEQEFGISVGKLMQGTDGYKYYMNHRPFSIGAVPNGFSDFDESDEGGRYGAVYYDRLLTKQEVSDYELVPAHV